MRLTMETEDKELQSVFQKETINFKDLSRKQKLKHLWNYHKWKFLLPLLAVILGLASFFFLKIQKEDYLCLSLLNSNADLTDYEYLQNDFAAYANLDLEKYEVSIDALAANFSTREQIAVKFFASTVDMVLCDEDSFSLYYKNGCFAPLEDYIPDNFYKKYPFEPLTYFDKEDQKEHTYGIRLKDNGLLRKYFIDPPVVAISLKAPHKEAAGEYLQYLLEQQNNYTQ